MGPIKPKTKSSESSSPILSIKNIKHFGSSLLDFFLKKILTFKIFYERECYPVVTAGLLILEILLNIVIINRVSYTEIDWSTYMQQVECFLNGTRDYEMISGDTGPIVYPAGHLWFYSLLYYLTDRGQNIRRAQYIFMFLYLATIFVVSKLYQKYSNIPPYVLVFMCCTSYRVHSIYLLRMFNDPVAMLFFYLSLLFFTEKKWIQGSILYSMAVSFKMNILLFAPGLFLVYMEHLPVFGVIKNLVICAAVQIFVAFPFLVSHPKSYLIRSFNLGRVFMHKWTVNYRFMPEKLFVHPGFHITLLAIHLILLFLIFKKRWIRLIRTILGDARPSSTVNLSGNYILLTMFMSNFIGVSLARSLHYQFYVWYYHSLPYILWHTNYKAPTKICILGILELVWNIYPSTAWSSGLLHLVHLSILIEIIKTRAVNQIVDNDDIRNNKIK